MAGRPRTADHKRKTQFSLPTELLDWLADEVARAHLAGRGVTMSELVERGLRIVQVAPELDPETAPEALRCWRQWCEEENRIER